MTAKILKAIRDHKRFLISTHVNPDPVYVRPAPRKPFVRLSEEEVSQILSSAHTPYEAVCATENRLIEKNK